METSNQGAVRPRQGREEVGVSVVLAEADSEHAVTLLCLILLRSQLDLFAELPHLFGSLAQ